MQTRDPFARLLIAIVFQVVTVQVNSKRMIHTATHSRHTKTDLQLEESSLKTSNSVTPQFNPLSVQHIANTNAFLYTNAFL